MTPVCLSIAGSDPSGGAGIQADLKVFHQHQTYGMSVLTLLTVQNTCTVREISMLKADFVRSQLEAVLSDIPPNAAKTGALGNEEIISQIAEMAKGFSFPLVVDPVMISKHGLPLLDPGASAILTEKLLPHAFLVTPNVPEASTLAEMQIDTLDEMKDAARKISQRGPKNVLIKGGHLEGDSVDLLWSEGESHLLPAERIETKNTHGTGCVFSAAITARLARKIGLVPAVIGAKQFISKAILTNPSLGKGYGPTNMLCPLPEDLS